MALTPGQLVGQRFVVEAVSGSGGMSTVFRAVDKDNGATVALKVLQVEGKGTYALDRFHREVRLLSKLNHPRIAKYVSHGRTEQGQPFLVMEWLHGEDLAARLRRGRLSPQNAFDVTRQLAEALAAIHRLGIVHRDIKPSNLFLRDGDLGQVVLLDFGIARRKVHAPSLIRAGAVIGTPGYMAPEQACGDRSVLPSADIFSLGCVLYECLAGVPPFASEHIAGVLAKVLFEEPPLISTVRPEVPQPLAALLDRMLTKAPQQRFLDGTELADCLQAIAERGQESAPISPTQRAEAWLADEQWLCTVVVAAPRGTLMGNVTLSTEEIDQDSARRSGLRAALLKLGARAEWLPDGSLVATLTAASTGNAIDQVTGAAHAALLIYEQWPEALIVLATGRAVMQDTVPVGEAIDRAMQLLHELSMSSTAVAVDSASGLLDRVAGVRLDELSTELLGTGFALSKDHRGCWLHSERATADETRPLLGRPTPCVGRDQELQLLDTKLSGCIAESRACAVLVKAPPGIGKSRLRHEFLRRLAQQRSRTEILFGRGNPHHAGSSSSLVGQMLRHLCELRNGEELATQQAKLRGRLGRFLVETDDQPILAFLAELCNVSGSVDCVQLRTARRDPNLMADWLMRSFLAWVNAECRQRPMLIVLEDLHWGDPLSVKLIDEALRELRDMPLMVLALARPEIDQVFPALWAERVQQLSLQGLGQLASESLIKLVLGDRIEPQDAQRIVQQAAGNALFLEELIRAAAKPTKGDPSDTVVAMLQARIGRLALGARRVLTTASLFGNTFWRGGILDILGLAREPEEVNPWLASLVQEEIISQHPESGFVGDVEYGFRHGLVRDAAYSLLTDAARKQGHRLVGNFLEGAGEPDAFNLAEHFGNSDDPVRAVPWYIAAGERELAGNDLDQAWLCTERGLRCGAAGQHIGALWSLKCAVHFWRHDWVAVYPAGSKALPMLSPGSLRWCTVIGHLLISVGSAGKADEFASLVRVCIEAKPEPDARSAHLEAIAKLVAMLSALGARERARICLERITELVESQEEDPYCLGWKYMSLAIYKRSLDADPWGAMVTARAAAAAFFQAGSVRNWLLARAVLSYTENEVGSWAEAEAISRDALREGQRLCEPLIVKHACAYLAWMLVHRSDPGLQTEAAELVKDIAEHPELTDGGNATAHCALALRASAGGDLRRAETYADLACQNCLGMPVERLQSLTVLIQIYLLQGCVEKAKKSVADGMVLLAQVGCAGHAEVAFRLAAAEVYHAEGAFEEAHTALQETLRQIQIRGAGIPDSAARIRYCSVPTENARALLLARAWLGHEVTIAEDGGLGC